MNSDNQTQTEKDFEKAIAECRELFIKKLSDYGTSWRVMRPSSLTDQIFIKARRIRYIEENGKENAKIEEGRRSEFIGIVNYGAIALIQLKMGSGDPIPSEEALKLYDDVLRTSTSLMLDKNHDYDEAWRSMRISSFTDIILQKLYRTKEIEDHGGKTLVSEGLDANFMDIINYALFALIKLEKD